VGVLRAVSIALALAGCYSPELAECAVACSAEADCGDGQTCNAEGLCASAGVSCRASGDAAVTADAPVEPDAPPPQTTLRIHVMDRGEVRLAGHAPCTMEDDCLVPVDSGERVTLTAEPLEDRVFDKSADEDLHADADRHRGARDREVQEDAVRSYVPSRRP